MSEPSPFTNASNAGWLRAFREEDGGSPANTSTGHCSKSGAQRVQRNVFTHMNERRQLWMFIALPAASRGMSITCGMRPYSKQVCLWKKRKRGGNYLAQKGSPRDTGLSFELSAGNSGKASSMWCIVHAVRLVHSRTRIER